MLGFERRMSTVTAAKRLIPLLGRVLVEKIVPPSRSAGGILLPETTAKLNSGTVIEVGPGVKNKEGNVVPLDVKKGDTVLLPEFGGSLKVSSLKAESKCTNHEDFCCSRSLARIRVLCEVRSFDLSSRF